MQCPPKVCGIYYCIYRDYIKNFENSILNNEVSPRIINFNIQNNFTIQVFNYVFETIENNIYLQLSQKCYSFVHKVWYHIQNWHKKTYDSSKNSLFLIFLVFSSSHLLFSSFAIHDIHHMILFTLIGEILARRKFGGFC